MQKYKKSRMRLAASRSAREYRTAVEDQDFQLFIGSRVLPAAVGYLRQALIQVEQRTSAERQALKRLLVCSEIDNACNFLASADDATLDLFCELCNSGTLGLSAISSHRDPEAAMTFVGAMTSSGLAIVEENLMTLTPLGVEIRRWLSEFKAEAIQG